MSEWVEELTKALTEEFGNSPHICTLASVDKHGAPRARSVVVRRVSADGSIWIASDGRSEKNEQLKASPHAELCFWLPNRREQFRVGGSVKVLASAADAAVRLEIWKTLSDGTRATFLWPTPGAKRIEPPESFARAIDAANPLPPSFELLVLRPRRVELLQLSQHPHRRRRWMLAGNWSVAAEVNP